MKFFISLFLCMVIAVALFLIVDHYQDQTEMNRLRQENALQDARMFAAIVKDCREDGLQQVDLQSLQKKYARVIADNEIDFSTPANGLLIETYIDFEAVQVFLGQITALQVDPEDMVTRDDKTYIRVFVFIKEEKDV